MLMVKNVMTSPVITVRPDLPLKEVARLLVDSGVSGVPVVEDGIVLGVVSEGDFLVKEQGPGEIRHRRLARLIGESESSRRQLDKVEARTAAQAMTAPAITIGTTCSIREAAATMTSRRVNRLPVIDRGRLVGIVTRADLVKAYIRSDAELVATIRDEVLHRILWLDPAAFDVAVVNGEASIRGRVERRSSAQAIADAVTMVPGIVAVKADVTWEMDDRDITPVESDPVFPYGLR